jgi:hypothetical protein
MADRRLMIVQLPIDGWSIVESDCRLSIVELDRRLSFVDGDCRLSTQ